MYFKRNLKDLMSFDLAWHRLIPLRQRYIMNRAGRIRLRYSLAVAAAFVLSLNAAWGSFAERMGFDDSLLVANLDLPTWGGEGNALFADAGSLAYEEPSYSLKERINGSFPDINKILKSKGPVTAELEIEKGQTLAGLLQEAGVSGDEAYNAVQSISKYADPRKILPGQKLKVRLEPQHSEETEDGGFILSELVMPLDKLKFVSLKRGADGYSSQVHEKQVEKVARAGYTTIETSLYGSAARSGIPSSVIADVIRIYSWDIDFQRDIRKGDKIEVLYDAYETEDGDTVKYGDIIYANLTIGGQSVPLYRFDMDNGRTDYFDPKGQSIKKTLMKTPIDGGRITSGFGLRKHPILGYNKMHKGVDFGAPVGTPVYAAGDGTIEKIGRFSSYGNYIRIRHNGRIKTAYGHLHNFAKGLKPGSRVQQGQVIAYVGATGRATGPHLHYEVQVNGVQVNPNSVDLPTGEQLLGKELKRFKSLVDKAHQQFVSLSKSLKFAALGDEGRKDSDGPG
ncbi:MAG: peptidoglycan DD-metalloendopeptidase family protein [Alphaproteobacteria bacterium]|nr:peptidoglycan DD-metalloendopeptidase family protein [Alphaproteobacteria bacterium]